MSKLHSNLIKTIVLPIADMAMKTNLASSYKLISRMQSYSSEEITNWQNKQLKFLIEQAYNHSKYYNRLLNNSGVLPDDINSIEDLVKLPALTKETIRDHFDEIIPDNIKLFPYKKSATGGSTGDPLKYLLDNRSWSMTNANSIINWEKVGYKYGDKFIALGSTSLHVSKSTSLKHKIYYKIKNKIGLNGINMSDEVCEDYINFIKREKIYFIYGYASAIYLLAKYALENNKDVKIQACFPTSEVLTDHFRKTIHEAFYCEILDCYGANDGGVTAFAKEKGFFEVGYNCLVRIENPDQHGVGPALLTVLSNYAMPMINYKLGDNIRIDDLRNKDYPYNGQVINEVLGRTSDILYLENGRILTGPGFTVLFKDIPVDYYCIEKDSTNSLICWMIKLPEYNDNHEKLVLQTLNKQAGDDITIGFRYIEEPFLSESGKRKYFIDDNMK